MNINDKSVFEIQGHEIIPGISSQVAVATDINSRRVLFKIPMYIDGYNIEDCTISVRCITAAGRFVEFILTNTETRTGDDNTYIYAEWVMSADVTATEGIVTYDISICDKTKTQYAWHTLPSTFTVMEGMKIPTE